VRRADHKSGVVLSIVCVRVSGCDPETSAMRKPEPTRAVEVLKKCNSDFECVDNA
jgi:hypothetical protein